MKSIAVLLLLVVLGCKSKSTQKPDDQKPTTPTSSLNQRTDTVPLQSVAPDTMAALSTNKGEFYYETADKDVYKVSVVPDEIPQAGAPINCSVAGFSGTDRKAAKISIATVTMELKTLDSFIRSLKTDVFMKNLKISKNATSNRVSFEKRNVKLKTVFLYAIKREPDNDYHLIIGSKTGAPFFAVELSGLPLAGSVAFAKLKQVRKVVEDHFGILCDANYRKFSPGIPIEVAGSLFFDVDHDGGTVGPAGLRPQTAWEIHPITSLLFQ